jgi:maleate isomerase
MRPDVLRIGVLTPHAAVGPEEELPAMAPGRVATRVVRVRSAARGAGRDPPATPAALSPLTADAVLDRAADALIATCQAAVLALRVLRSSASR